ncbi:MAG: zinc ribbon domain-containing protein [Methanomicrobia archaeon]|nr:zinc ribbon domain-containing protein [Methanomicrobia archaeon]
MEKEEFHIKLKIPEFVKILDEPIREEVLKEVEKKIRPDVEREFHQAAKEAINKKLDLLETPKKQKPPSPKEEKTPVKKTKHCPKCGKEIDTDAKFCRFCGANL